MGLVWATRTDLQRHTRIEFRSIFCESVKERIKSKLRTAHTSKHWSEIGKERQNLAVQMSKARELHIFLAVTLVSEGNYCKPWEKYAKAKIAPFGRKDTC